MDRAEKHWHAGITANVNGITSIEHRYYILSIESNVHRFAQAVRGHWSIENQLHWILDVGFAEDASQACQGYSAENLAVIRDVGLNLRSRDKKLKLGLRPNDSKLAGTTTILRVYSVP